MLLGTLAEGLGCFPRVRAVYPARADSHDMDRWYSEFGWGRQPGVAPSPSSSSTPIGELMRLTLELFRGEPAITKFDWSFAPSHISSHSFSTLTGSVLPPLLGGVQPGHG